MQIFDRLDARKLEQRDAELWILAIVVIIVLAGGMALLMYPSTVSETMSGGSVRKIFFGFCALSLLLVGYLVERQVMVRHLRRQLAEERTRTSRLLSQASADLLDSLPGYTHFRERLALDFGRAAYFQQPLSLVVARLKASPQVCDSEETATVFVDAVKAMIRKLRGEDSIYQFAPGVFGILLPGVFGDDADRVSQRLAAGLTDASGANGRFSFDLRVVNYPGHTATESEIEEIAHSYIAGVSAEKQPV